MVKSAWVSKQIRHLEREDDFIPDFIYEEKPPDLMLNSNTSNQTIFVGCPFCKADYVVPVEAIHGEHSCLQCFSCGEVFDKNKARLSQELPYAVFTSTKDNSELKAVRKDSLNTTQDIPVTYTPNKKIISSYTWFKFLLSLSIILTPLLILPLLFFSNSSFSIFQTIETIAQTKVQIPPPGIVIEKTQTKWTTSLDGKSILVLTGQIRNGSSHTLGRIEVEVSLFDYQGNLLSAYRTPLSYVKTIKEMQTVSVKDLQLEISNVNNFKVLKVGEINSFTGVIPSKNRFEKKRSAYFSARVILAETLK
jgi:hypothetical protein